MANAAVDIGTGASAVFGTSALSLNWTSIDLGNESREVIDTVHLGTSGFKTKMGGDLAEASEWVFEFQWDNEAIPVTSATPETATVTYPQATANTVSAATTAATGMITDVKHPNLEVEGLQTGTLTFTPDGATGPTHTPGA